MTDIKGAEIDVWQARTENFISVMVQLVKQMIETPK
jgi:hypothetical protein